jgi:hypothetical protein
MAAEKLYLAVFDLLHPGDYASLKTRLAAMGAQQILERVWAMLTPESAREVKAVLRGFVGGQDRILVVELGRDWASRHALFPLGELIEPRGGPAQMLWRQKWLRGSQSPRG